MPLTPASFRFRFPEFFLSFAVLLLSVLVTGCGIAEAVAPQKGKPLKALDLDPTEEHALVGGLGARWVIFKLDVGIGARRIIQTTADGVATVGQAVSQSVAQRMVEARPEEDIMAFFQAAREASRVDYARNTLRQTAPPFPSSFVP